MQTFPLFLPSSLTASWLLGWAESSSDPSVWSHCLRKHGPIMAINNNGRAHLAWWLMGLSHSSFTWLLCGHQQPRSNVMLSKWAFHRILYDSRVEQRHQDGTYRQKHGSETGKKSRRNRIYLQEDWGLLPLLHVAMHAQTSCVCSSAGSCHVCASVLEKETSRSIHQHQLPRHGGRLIVSVWSGNKPATSHTRTQTLQIPYMYLSDTCPLTLSALMPSVLFDNELSEKW